MIEPRTIDLRVHTEILKLPKRRRRGRRKPGEPLLVDSGVTLKDPPDKWSRCTLILDCETPTDQCQSLMFGSYQYCRARRSRFVTVEEGIFYRDDLDPHSLSILQRYCEAPKLRLRSRSEFMKRVFWRAVRAEALIVGFNLPFDLSRLAVECCWTQRRGGAWSFTMGQYVDSDTGQLREDTYKPRIIVKPKDGKGAFFRSARSINPKPYPPIRCLDLKTLVWALQSKSHSLDSACQAYGVSGKLSGHKPTGRVTIEEIEYNRQDVRASVGLLNATRAEFDLHPIELAPDEAYSAASIAKAYFKDMGLVEPRVKFNLPPEALGIAMQSYYGGRAECRIRHTPVPVVYTDFLSQYPTVNTLMGLWWILTAERLRLEHVTDEVRDLLSQITLDRVFEPDFWMHLRFFAQVEPDGDILPVRSDYKGETSNIGVNPLTSAQPIWYAGPDLVASALLTGQPPKIIKAFKLVPEGLQAGLTSTKLRGSVEIDPRKDDLFKKMVEARAQVKRDERLPKPEREALSYFLKILANAGSYGLFVEVNPERLGKDAKTGKPARARVRVYAGEEVFETTSEFIEKPGPWYFPPIAALITAAGRLLLALLERMVTDAGGTYLMCDTDSMAIVASEYGGLIPCEGGLHRLPDGREEVKALSWAEVKRIVAQFESLNPYDRSVVPGSILKIEDVNFDSNGAQREFCGYSISAKRYALFTQTPDGIEIVKASAHGLGYLFPPKPGFDDKLGVHVWVREAWDYILRGMLGLPRTEPKWSGLPAMMRFTINTPEILRALQKRQAKLPYHDRIKPFSFGLMAIINPVRGSEKVTPIAPFTDDLPQWLRLQWVNQHDGEPCRPALPGQSLPGEVEVQTYGWLLGLYRWHSEAKSLAPDGTPCAELTAGLLGRTPVTAGDFGSIGKETDRRWEREEDISVVEPHRLEYQLAGSARRNESLELRELQEKLRRYQAKEIKDISGVSVRTIKAVRNGQCHPKPETVAALHRAVQRLESERGPR